MFNYSSVKPATLSAHAHAHAANNVNLLNFSKPATVAASSLFASSSTHSPSAPAPKSWFTKKFIPVVKRVGDIAGKVATVASVL
jgi:hypothetical protein